VPPSEGVLAVAEDRAAEVVDHDGRAATSQVQGVLPAEPSPSAGDDGNLSVEIDHN
jgi:hypothetical protein